MATSSKSLQGSDATLTLDSNSPTVIVQNITPPPESSRLPDALPILSLPLHDALLPQHEIATGHTLHYQISG
jgi:hypothetical protein